MTSYVLSTYDDVMMYLPERNTLDDVAQYLRPALIKATDAIAARTRQSFTPVEVVEFFDVSPRVRYAPGAHPSVFTPNPYTTFMLKAQGGVTALSVKVRGTRPYDATLDWSEVAPLTEHDDYVYDPDTGALTLLFTAMPGIRQVQVTYAHAHNAAPLPLAGQDRVDHLALCAAESELQPIASLFLGTRFKPDADNATATVTQPDLASISIQPPEAIALNNVTLHAPSASPIISVSQPVTLVLVGVDGGDTVLDTKQINLPANGASYQLAGDPHTAYPSYRIDVSGTLDTDMSVKLVRFNFADNDLFTLKGSVPTPMSNACAALAAHYYQQSRSGRTLSQEDDRDEALSDAIPSHVAAMLAPYRRTYVSTF